MVRHRRSSSSSGGRAIRHRVRRGSGRRPSDGVITAAHRPVVRLGRHGGRAARRRAAGPRSGVPAGPGPAPGRRSRRPDPAVCRAGPPPAPAPPPGRPPAIAVRAEPGAGRLAQAPAGGRPGSPGRRRRPSPGRRSARSTGSSSCAGGSAAGARSAGRGRRARSRPARTRPSWPAAAGVPASVSPAWTRGAAAARSAVRRAPGGGRAARRASRAWPRRATSACIRKIRHATLLTNASNWSHYVSIAGTGLEPPGGQVDTTRAAHRGLPGGRARPGAARRVLRRHHRVRGRAAAVPSSGSTWPRPPSVPRSMRSASSCGPPPTRSPWSRPGDPGRRRRPGGQPRGWPPPCWSPTDRRHHVRHPGRAGAPWQDCAGAPDRRTGPALSGPGGPARPGGHAARRGGRRRGWSTRRSSPGWPPSTGVAVTLLDDTAGTDRITQTTEAGRDARRCSPPPAGRTATGVTDDRRRPLRPAARARPRAAAATGALRGRRATVRACTPCWSARCCSPPRWPC